MVIDCFPYFNEKEILELRINILNNYVDKFLIFDANYTHSGIPKPFTCKQTILDLGLVSDKIEIIELDLSDEKLPISDEYDKLWNSDAILGSRERLQRDGILSVLDNFDDNDVFIVSDCDEIINPININNIAELSLFVPHSDWVFEKEHITSKSKNSAFLGHQMKGKALGIYNNGYLILNT